MKDATSGMQFLQDLKYRVLQTLQNKGYGLEDAEALAESAKKEVLCKLQRGAYYIPNLKSLNGGEAREKVIALYKEGKPVAEIIRTVGLGHSTVYSYIRGRNNPPKRSPKAAATCLEILNEIKMHTAKALLTKRVASTIVKEVADDLQSFLVKVWGGIMVSFPSVLTESRKANTGSPGGGLAFKRDRAERIFTDYRKGTSYDELAVKYSLGRDQVKWVVKRMKRKSKEDDGSNA